MEAREGPARWALQMKCAGLVAVVSAALTSMAAAAPPQMPLARGKIEAILPAAEAAYKCGIVNLRLETARTGLVHLYSDTPTYANDPGYNPAALKCAEEWVKRNAAKFGLKTGYFD